MLFNSSAAWKIRFKKIGYDLNNNYQINNIFKFLNIVLNVNNN